MTERIRVVLSPHQGTSNPFVGIFAKSLPPEVEVLGFTWRRALLGRYDVLHVHWPDALYAGRRAPVRFVRRVLFSALLLRNRLLRVPHVWTVHNLEPHETATAWGRALYRAWAESCTTRLHLSQAGLEEYGDPTGVVIPRGDFAPLLESLPPIDRAPVAGRLALYGVLRPYKGVERLIEVMSDPATADLSVVIAGRALDPSYGRQLRDLAAAAPRVEFRDVRMTDEELVRLISSVEVVLLPYLRINNSASALLALSAGCPVIVTASPTMLELRDEVGDEWVQCLGGPLTATTLTEAIGQLRSKQRGPRPVFSERDWTRIGQAHLVAYREAAGRS